jgi:hypothetical protein
MTLAAARMTRASSIKEECMRSSSTSRFAALLLAAAAMFVFASTAAAKGGGDGGGGGNPCGQITSFVNTIGTSINGPTLTTDYSVFNGCVDEFGATVSLSVRNNTTGFVGTTVNMVPLGAWSYTTGPRVDNSAASYTITLTFYAPGGGKVLGTRSETVTMAVAPALAA